MERMEKEDERYDYHHGDRAHQSIGRNNQMEFEQHNSCNTSNERKNEALDTTTERNYNKELSHDNPMQPPIYGAPREPIRTQGAQFSNSIPIESSDNNIPLPEDRDDYNYDDEDIQRDAATEHMAVIVHIALGFFFFLFMISMIVAIIIVGKYGFLTFVIVIALIFTVLILTYFISKTLDQDKILKPARRKIRRWHAVATAVIVNEIKDFQLDINEHLMLTNGDAYNDDCSSIGGAYQHMDDKASRKKRKGPRSKMFRFIVKPLLKKKNGRRFNFRKRNKNTNDENNDNLPVDGDHEMV